MCFRKSRVLLLGLALLLLAQPLLFSADIWPPEERRYTITETELRELERIFTQQHNTIVQLEEMLMRQASQIERLQISLVEQERTIERLQTSLSEYESEVRARIVRSSLFSGAGGMLLGAIIGVLVGGGV